MQIVSADALVLAMRDSGLFTPEQLGVLVRELAPLGDDPPALMRHLVQNDHLTVYQLRKVVHGKAAELHFGDYVVLDKLGEGGMGKVYKARQTRLGRDVAIKIVRSNLLANPVVRRRYEREVQAASNLHHPNVVSVFDAGEVDGRYYMAMEFVDGIDLARLVRDHGILPVQEACEYARQTALGLQHAHEHGFVHRDIKPSNIVVSGERHVPQATEPAFVKVLDMGLVREIGFDDGPDGANLTRDGTVVGTPDYMSPEQARNSSTVDHRADLYSLGCAMYFLLTGRPPFAEGSPIEKILKHQVEPPPSVRDTRWDVPAAVEDIIHRLMAKKADDRFRTASDVAAALEPHCTYPGSATPLSVRTRRAAARAAAVTDPNVTQSTIAPPPVSPSDTPRPTERPRRMGVRRTPPSPFSFPLEPPSGPVEAIRTAAPRPNRRPPPRGNGGIVLAVVVAAVLSVGIATWALVSSASKTTPAQKK